MLLLLGGILTARGGTTDEELLALLSPWTATLDVSLRLGHRDNVLFSSFNPEPSSFLGSVAEGVVTRRLQGTSSLEAYGMIDYRQYLEAEQLDEETLAFAYAGWRTDEGGAWSYRAATEYLFQNQVVDVSANEADLSIVEVLGHVITLRTAARRALGQTGWIEAEGRGERSLYDLPLDDTWQGGTSLTGGWSPRSRSELTLAYGYDHRFYDEELARNADGSTKPGTLRENHRHELRLIWRERWDDRERLGSTLRLAGRLNRDGESGYYDYDRWSVDARVRCSTGNWRFDAGPRAAYYDYRVQDDGKRRRTELGVDTSAQWTLDPHVALVFEYSWEQTLANAPEEEYAINTWMGSVKLSF